MKDRLLAILKTGSVSGRLITCRNTEERAWLKGFLSGGGHAQKTGAAAHPSPGVVAECSSCPGVVERKKPFGSGINRVMVVLNAPRLSGRMEIDFYRADAADLLRKMFASIDVELNECYVTNLVKCESSDSLLKLSDMVKNCLPVLKSEIDAVKPLVVIVMGEIVPLQQVVNSSRGIAWFNTDHAISLIKNPDMKRSAWETLKTVRKKLHELGGG